MAHTHRLYEPTEAECTCCHLLNTFTFKTRFDNVVCERCRRHLGDHRAKARDVEHLQMWQAAYQQEATNHARTEMAVMDNEERFQREREAFQAKISDFEAALKLGLDARPVETILHWYQQIKINESRAREAKAHGFIVHLFGVLLLVDEHHHRDDDDDDDDRCSCGEPTDKCAVFGALADVRGKLYSWESEQVTRARAGQQHELPRWHRDAQSSYYPRGR